MASPSYFRGQTPSSVMQPGVLASSPHPLQVITRNLLLSSLIAGATVTLILACPSLNMSVCMLDHPCLLTSQQLRQICTRLRFSTTLQLRKYDLYFRHCCVLNKLSVYYLMSSYFSVFPSYLVA